MHIQITQIFWKKRHSKLFKAKAKAAAAVGSIIENATGGRDEGVKAGHSKERKGGVYRRYDVIFGLPAGIEDVKVYTGKLVVWCPNNKKKTFYDITNIKFDRKVRNAANAAAPTEPRQDGVDTLLQSSVNEGNISQNT